ncbi:Sodium-dependent phosphate transporter 1-A [Holothuria leucospilota]|uniref:Phosphate transporter n=1 Tax=Holothuria leucospilota TaxID=206669 RepID=A0A9Q0YGR8_HOLLE|nr:Sodium-dependent phosphate transporter 1-A [Holothuria leucospilota]
MIMAFDTSTSININLLIQSDVVWILIVGFLIAFVLSFAVGANDVANSFGTSVGANVLSLRQAFCLATIFETLGAVLLGSAVAKTISAEVVNLSLYNSTPEVLMVGQLAVLTACAVWLLIATALKLPVSTTHSIVGAMVGFQLVTVGTSGVQWRYLFYIAGSWIISPILAGGFAAFLNFILLYTIVKKEDPFHSGLKTLPAWYGVVILVNALSILLSAQNWFTTFEIPWYVIVAVSVGCAMITSFIVCIIVVPQLGNYDNEIYPLTNYEQLTPEEDRETDSHNPSDAINASESSNKSQETKGTNSSSTKQLDNGGLRSKQDAGQGPRTVREDPAVKKICGPLQILSAVFSAFAHGSNDVSNSVAPLIVLWNVYSYRAVPSELDISVWMFLYGGFGLSVGLWILGKRVIDTVGERITTLSSSRGFAIELGSAAVVLMASNIGIPISTTHSKIGAVAALGCFGNGEGVNLMLLCNIAVAWLVTLPFVAGLSAFITYIFQLSILPAN